MLLLPNQPESHSDKGLSADYLYLYTDCQTRRGVSVGCCAEGILNRKFEIRRGNSERLPDMNKYLRLDLLKDCKQGNRLASPTRLLCPFSLSGFPHSRPRHNAWIRRQAKLKLASLFCSLSLHGSNFISTSV